MSIDDLVAAAAAHPDDAAAVQAWLDALGPEAASATAPLPALEAPWKIEKETRRHGVVSHFDVTCAKAGDAAARARFAGRLRELLALPALRLVEKLVVFKNSNFEATARCDVRALWSRFPRLANVTLVCRAVELGAIPTGLEELFLGCQLDEAAARAISEARFPSLRRLSLRPGKLKSPAFAALLAGDGLPSLRDLYLDGAEQADGFCKDLSPSLAARLEDLSFENSGLSDIGAELLAEKPLKLKWLRLDGCELSRESIRLLEPLAEEFSI